MHIHRHDFESITALRVSSAQRRQVPRACRSAKNYVADASQPHESRDKTLRQCSANRNTPTHSSHSARRNSRGKANYVAKNEFS
jgi:hypothetical protein